MKPASRRLSVLAWLALASLACSQLGPTPTLPPAPATATASPSPGPETPTPRPEALTQPAPTDAEPTAAGTALPPLTGQVFAPLVAIGDDVPGTVLDLHFAPDGLLWLLTDQMVARLAGAWEIYLPEYQGDLVGVDDLGRVWVAAADGTSIAAWTGTEWLTYGGGEAWTPVLVELFGSAVQPGVTGDQTGRVWVATAQDVRAFDGERWEVFDHASLGMAEATDEEARSQFTIHIARRDGAVWVSHCTYLPPGPAGGGGVRWLDGDEWQGGGSPVEAGCGGALTSSTSGRVWVGLDHRVLAYDPDSAEWTTFDSPAPPTAERFGMVADLALDPLEQPWPLLTLCGGASCEVGQVRYQLAADGAWTQIGPVSEAQQALFFDLTGSGWLLSEEGALRATGDQAQPASDMRVIASTSDGHGQIFVVGEQAGEVALWLIRPGAE